MQEAIWGLGDSFMSMTGSPYGVGIPDRLAGDLSGIPATWSAFPGEGAATILAQMQAATAFQKGSVVILSSGRNSVLSDPSGTLANIADTYAEVADGRCIISEVPLKVAETSGPDYDKVIAHNIAINATYPGKVIATEDLAQLYPSGDGVHISSDGYEFWAIRASEVIRSNAWLDTSLRSTLTDRSIDISVVDKYASYDPVAAQPDTLPASVTEESTWSVWYKGTGSGYMFGRLDSDTSANRLGIRISGGSALAFAGTGFASGAHTPDGNWHLYTMRIRNNVGWKVSLFVDGVQLGSEVAVGTYTTAHNIRMGEASAGISWNPVGLYLDPVIWNTALTDGEIASMTTRKAASALPQAASIVSFVDFSRLRQPVIARGIPDLAGNLDVRAQNLGTNDLSVDVA